MGPKSGERGIGAEDAQRRKEVLVEKYKPIARNFEQHMRDMLGQDINIVKIQHIPDLGRFHQPAIQGFYVTFSRALSGSVDGWDGIPEDDITKREKATEARIEEVGGSFLKRLQMGGKISVVPFAVERSSQ